jgi:hypothetical protein
MAAENPPYAIQADSHGAELFRLAAGSLLPRGVHGLQSAQGGIVDQGDLLVTGGAGNTVNVAVGQGWIPGTQGAHQGLYYGYNDAVVNLAVTPNASNPLYAIVTASVNDQAYTGNPGVANNTWNLIVTQGVAAPSPSIPATPPNSLLLSTILVPASASSSSSYTITDNRPTIGAPAGRVYAPSAQNLFSTANTITCNTTSYLRGGVTAGANGLTVPVAGVYHVCAQMAVALVAAAECWIDIFKNGSLASQGALGQFGSAVPFDPTVADNLLLAAGDTLTVSVGFAAVNFHTLSAGSGAWNYLSAHLVSV